MSCRLANIGDLPTLLIIEQSAFPPGRWASEKSLRERLELPAQATWLAFYENQPVGFANGFPIKDLSTQQELDPDDSSLFSQESKFWLLRNVAVRPEFQGKGIGKQLIQAQLNSAKEYGSKYFRFTASENLTSYYSNLGFRMIRPPEAFHGLPQSVWESEL